MMTTEQLKRDEKAILEILNTKRIWWTGVQLTSALEALFSVPTTRIEMILQAFVNDGYVLVEHGAGYALSKDGRALLEGWDTPKAQPILDDIIKGIPRGAVYFSLSWSPDRLNWRAELNDDKGAVMVSDRREPVEAVIEALEKWKHLQDSMERHSDE